MVDRTSMQSGSMGPLFAVKQHTENVAKELRFGRIEHSDHEYRIGAVGQNLSKVAWEHMIHFPLY